MFKLTMPKKVSKFFENICAIFFDLAPFGVLFAAIWFLSAGIITIVIFFEGWTYDTPKYQLILDPATREPSRILMSASYDRCSKIDGSFINAVSNAMPALYFDWASSSCQEDLKEYTLLNGVHVSDYTGDQITKILSEDLNVKLLNADDAEVIIIKE